MCNNIEWGGAANRTLDLPLLLPTPPGGGGRGEIQEFLDGEIK